ncbi:hypothetical protein ACH2G3_25450, partial [Bacillus cereus]
MGAGGSALGGYAGGLVGDMLGNQGVGQQIGSFLGNLLPFNTSPQLTSEPVTTLVGKPLGSTSLSGIIC